MSSYQCDITEQDLGKRCGEMTLWACTSQSSYLWLERNIYLPHNPEHVLLIIIPKEMCLYVHQKLHGRMFITTKFIKARNWQQPPCPPEGDEEHTTPAGTTGPLYVLLFLFRMLKPILIFPGIERAILSRHRKDCPSAPSALYGNTAYYLV